LGMDAQPEQDPQVPVAGLHQPGGCVLVGHRLRNTTSSVAEGHQVQGAYPPGVDIRLHFGLHGPLRRWHGPRVGGASGAGSRGFVGVVDGEPAPAPAFPPFNVLPPVWTVRQDRQDGDRRARRLGGGRADVRWRGRFGHPDGDDDEDERRRQPPRYNNDHPDCGWERHHHHDDQEDGDGNSGNHGARTRSLHGATGAGQEPVFRERERLPPRRHWGSGKGDRRRDASSPSPVHKLPALHELQAENDARYKFLFKAQATSIQDVASNLLKNNSASARPSHDLVMPVMEDYIHKALRLADRLGITDAPPLETGSQLGNEALSASAALPTLPGPDGGTGGADIPVHAAN